jgi:hypothetical protein
LYIVFFLLEQLINILQVIIIKAFLKQNNISLTQISLVMPKTTCELYIIWTREEIYKEFKRQLKVYKLLGRLKEGIKRLSYFVNKSLRTYFLNGLFVTILSNERPFSSVLNVPSKLRILRLLTRFYWLY